MKKSNTILLVLVQVLAMFSINGCKTTSGGYDLASQGNARPVGSMRGLEIVDKEVKNSLLDEKTPANDRFSVSQLANQQFLSFRKQLGVYTRVSDRWKFDGGSPNPLGITIWYQLLGRLAQASGEVCKVGSYLSFPGDAAENGGGNGTFALQAIGDEDQEPTSNNGNSQAGEVVPPTEAGVPMDAPPAGSFVVAQKTFEQIKVLCLAGKDSSDPQARESMRNLWNVIVGYDSAKERDVVINQFLSFAKLPTSLDDGSKFVESYFRLMLHNPYFLLAH